MNYKIVLVLFFCASISNAYKILFLSPFNGKSHWLYTSSFVKVLISRGHEVTFLTSISLKDSNLTNYSEVLIDPPFDYSSVMPQDDLINNFGGSPFSSIIGLTFFSQAYNSYNLQNENVQKFIKSTDQHFDLVIMEDFFTDCFLMFAHKFNAPVITISAFGPAEFIDRDMGLLTPWSFVPHWSTTYTDNMSFSERWMNSIFGIFDWAVRKLIFMPQNQNLAEQHFEHLGPLPSLEEIRRNISVVFINTHRSLSPPRPMMPGEINIGGAHVKPAKPLPADLQKFLDGSKHGVIYFSLSTVVQSSELPKEKIQAFLDVFRNLKQDVLWKFEDESLTDVPPNVKIRKWMPQNDILAHPNVVLFISHGGMFGTTESIYHGKPLLMIPFFGDQYRNAFRVKSAGYGDYLLFRDLTKETLLEKLTKMTSDESYAIKAKETSAIFNHNLAKPMDEAMWWIEHVCKFKGAEHAPFGPTDFHDRDLGLLTPWSFVPHWTTVYTDNMSFTERWFNSAVSIYDWVTRKFIFMPREQKFAEQFFGHLGPLPSLEDIRRNFSVVLINTHRSLSPPRPMMPNQINIGGAHIKPAKPLPADLQKFLDESKDGVIYFSLGTVVQSSALPKEKLQAFLGAFKNLKQRVLWKFEDESLSDIPSNVMIRKWMPQNDILAHPNVVLFISHGGLFSTTESLYHGKPLLLIPFFGDQHRNAFRVNSAGYGNYILFDDITKDTLLKAITDITSDESYLTRAKQTSAIFNHNIAKPMDEAIWWIEYVCKFKGAKHLRSNAVNMSLSSYLLLDVFAVTVLGFIAIVYIFCKVVKTVFGLKKTTQKRKQKKK